MKEKISSAKCPIHGSQPCEVFVEIRDDQRSQYNRKRRHLSKKIVEDELLEYYTEKRS
jgi:hypothetical protein